MPNPLRWAELQQLIREELRQLTTIKPSDWRWQMPLSAALATGLPLLAGAYFNQLDFGLVSMVCRFYALGPPGSLFFIMVAAIGAYTPLTLLQLLQLLPLMVGLILFGATERESCKSLLFPA